MNEHQELKLSLSFTQCLTPSLSPCLSLSIFRYLYGAQFFWSSNGLGVQGDFTLWKICTDLWWLVALCIRFELWVWFLKVFYMGNDNDMTPLLSPLSIPHLSKRYKNRYWRLHDWSFSSCVVVVVNCLSTIILLCCQHLNVIMPIILFYDSPNIFVEAHFFFVLWIDILQLLLLELLELELPWGLLQHDCSCAFALSSAL